LIKIKTAVKINSPIKMYSMCSIAMGLKIAAIIPIMNGRRRRRNGIWFQIFIRT
jgi:hypothetical protein